MHDTYYSALKGGLCAASKTCVRINGVENVISAPFSLQSSCTIFVVHGTTNIFRLICRIGRLLSSSFKFDIYQPSLLQIERHSQCYLYGEAFFEGRSKVFGNKQLSKFYGTLSVVAPTNTSHYITASVRPFTGKHGTVVGHRLESTDRDHTPYRN